MAATAVHLDRPGPTSQRDPPQHPSSGARGSQPDPALQQHLEFSRLCRHMSDLPASQDPAGCSPNEMEGAPALPQHSQAPSVSLHMEPRPCLPHWYYRSWLNNAQSEGQGSALPLPLQHLAQCLAPSSCSINVHPSAGVHVPPRPQHVPSQDTLLGVQPAPSPHLQHLADESRPHSPLQP